MKKLKNPNVRFSKLRKWLIVNQKKDPLKHFGIAKNLSEENLKGFEKTVKEGKKIDAVKSSSKFSEIWEE